MARVGRAIISHFNPVEVRWPCFAELVYSLRQLCLESPVFPFRLTLALGSNYLIAYLHKKEGGGGGIFLLKVLT